MPEETKTTPAKSSAGVTSSEFYKSLGIASAILLLAQEDTDPTVRITGLVVVGAITCCYILGRSIAKKGTA